MSILVIFVLNVKAGVKPAFDRSTLAPLSMPHLTRLPRRSPER